MAALSAQFNSPQMGSGVPKSMSYPVLTGVTIYEGALVVINASGYAKPAVSEASDIAVGRCKATIASGSASSGTYQVEVEQGVFLWDVNGTAVTIANLGALIYAYDDHTVTLSSSSASIAGTIYGLAASGTKAWVYTGLAAPLDGTSVTTISNTLAALKTNLVIPFTTPCILSAGSAASGTVVARFTPGMSGTLLKLNAAVIAAVTTTAKLATFTPAISGVSTSGGALALTSTNCATLGASVSGSAITGLNTITASQEVTIVASSVTAFTEGQVLLELFMQTA